MRMKAKDASKVQDATNGENATWNERVWIFLKLRNSDDVEFLIEPKSDISPKGKR